MRQRNHGVLTAAGLLTAATVLWRVGLLPMLSGLGAQYAATYACLLVWALAAAFVWRGARSFPLREIKDRPARPVGIAALLCGLAILLSQGVALVRLIGWNVAPAPASQIVNRVDGVLLWLALLSGIAAGLALGRIGVQWTIGQTPSKGAKSAMLLPVLWAWARLARYTVSYALAVRFRYSVFELLMLIASLVLLFLFGRRLHAGGEAPSATLVAAAFLTVVSGLSGVLTRVLLLWRQPDAMAVTVAIAGVPDLFLALLAAALLWYWTVLPVGDGEQGRLRRERTPTPAAEAERPPD